MTEFTVDLHNYPEGGSVFRRTAVRGIIERQGKYLLVRENTGTTSSPAAVRSQGKPWKKPLPGKSRRKRATP